MSLNQQARQQLLQALADNYHCAIEQEHFLVDHFMRREFAEKDHLINAGEVAGDIYFVSQGLLRTYYIDHSGNEINQQFYLPGEVIAPVISLVTREPSPFYLQTLADSTILQANYQALRQAGANDISWLSAENSILTSVYLKTARREAQMLLGGAEQRYRWFLKENPQLAEQLPLYQIASYLGVTPVSLSRLRKKLK